MYDGLGVGCPIAWHKVVKEAKKNCKKINSYRHSHGHKSVENGEWLQSLLEVIVTVGTKERLDLAPNFIYIHSSLLCMLDINPDMALWQASYVIKETFIMLLYT